ncbi:hypothetical protein [Streptomyces sp. NPDC005423]|uniref:hypothetical protein n=1 Tax=Streptomyces sp. NPDC005423 TaxID=3155343 RepID=UPI0033ADD036
MDALSLAPPTTLLDAARLDADHTFRTGLDFPLDGIEAHVLRGCVAARHSGTADFRARRMAPHRAPPALRSNSLSSPGTVITQS